MLELATNEPDEREKRNLLAMAKVVKQYAEQFNEL